MLKKLTATISLLFRTGVILLSIALVSFIVFSFKNKNEIIWIDSTIAEISKKSEYVEIVKINDNFIQIEGKTCKNYLLRIKDDNILLNQPFLEKKYTRNTEADFLADKVKLNEMCGIIKNINKGVPGSQIVEMTNSDNSFYKISKVTLEIANNLGNKVNELHLYVKGYADKSRTEWREKIDEKYDYRDIFYYHSADRFNEEYIINAKNIKLYKIIGDNYTNLDLPFLRAKYVADNYLVVI
ncbi:hypothetical protein [Thiolinea disciformis]|uniref:hypothetical protein n=1 Tax=Thiolinea disciformis TaxID=125614 RepID=UPI00035D8FB7|nr:hypothetical protein [Thiolinea disciformis]